MAVVILVGGLAGDRLVHPAPQGLTALLPERMVDAVEGVEGLPPALLPYQLVTAFELEAVAGPVLLKFVAQPLAVATALLPEGAQQRLGAGQVAAGKALEGPAAQLLLPILQLLSVGAACIAGDHQLALKGKGVPPAALLPELAGPQAPAVALG